MKTIDEQIERMYHIYGVSNDNQLSKELGFKSNSNIANWRNLGTIPAKWINKASVKMNINHINECKIYKIPILNQKVSAGHGETTIYNVEIEDELALCDNLFKTAPGKDIKAIQVKGDSMMPNIEDGSFVLFQEDPSYSGDELYIIVKNNELFVKRLHLDIQGNLHIISDNSKYPTDIINKDGQEYNFIIGKVKQVIPLFRG